MMHMLLSVKNIVGFEFDHFTVMINEMRRATRQ